MSTTFADVIVSYVPVGKRSKTGRAAGNVAINITNFRHNLVTPIAVSSVSGGASYLVAQLPPPRPLKFDLPSAGFVGTRECPAKENAIVSWPQRVLVWGDARRQFGAWHPKIGLQWRWS